MRWKSKNASNRNRKQSDLKRMLVQGNDACRALCFAMLIHGKESRSATSAFLHSKLPLQLLRHELYESTMTQYMKGPRASIVRIDDSDEQVEDLRQALQRKGFRQVLFFYNNSPPDDEMMFVYELNRATGMLKLKSSPSSNFVDDEFTLKGFDAPRWIPIVNNMENVLVANGWSFLDTDDNDPLSPFDIDAANLEGLYRPKWGQASDNDDTKDDEQKNGLKLSSLGFNLNKLSSQQIQQMADQLNPWSKSVLLDGKTDPPQRKLTQNNVKFTGSTGQTDIEQGIFTCAIGGLPLFTTIDLAPTTASSGWLSFTRPVADDHIVLIQPEEGSTDQRVEVVCARTGCHLGHYFGKGNGFCTNASALNFIAAAISHKSNQASQYLYGPESWRQFDSQNDNNQSLSIQLLKYVLQSNIASETLVLGAGCFWHVEFALRRLPGVIATEVGYAGGTTTAPTYSDVCEKDTGHAEVVKVTFDPHVLNPRVLLDCFLALHDPTKVRAHGKHAAGTGQYRSCIFVTHPTMERVANDALEDCRIQLKKELSTEVRFMELSDSHWFWRAEDYHQRHDERKRHNHSPANVSTLSAREWLAQYGKRSRSVLGSSETIAVETTTTTLESR